MSHNTFPITRLYQLPWFLAANGWSISDHRWQEIFYHLKTFCEKKSIPEDSKEIRCLLSPLICSNHKEQVDFVFLFHEWWESQKVENNSIKLSDHIKGKASVANDLANEENAQEILHLGNQKRKSFLEKFDHYRVLIIILFFVSTISLSTGLRLLWSTIFFSS